VASNSIFQCPVHSRARCGARSAALVLGLVLGLPGCSGERRELREWQASDHPAPAAVTPEGQGAGSEGPDATARTVASLWGMRCATCHGEAGHGDGAGKPPGAPIPDLSDPAFQAARSDAQLAQVINAGRGLMPAFSDQITEAGVTALVGHVRSLARGPR
jgi:mono/diheme cytochrome c family protein